MTNRFLMRSGAPQVGQWKESSTEEEGDGAEGYGAALEWVRPSRDAAKPPTTGHAPLADPLAETNRQPAAVARLEAEERRHTVGEKLGMFFFWDP